MQVSVAVGSRIFGNISLSDRSLLLSFNKKKNSKVTTETFLHAAYLIVSILILTLLSALFGLEPRSFQPSSRTFQRRYKRPANTFKKEPRQSRVTLQLEINLTSCFELSSEEVEVKIHLNHIIEQYLRQQLLCKSDKEPYKTRLCTSRINSASFVISSNPEKFQLRRKDKNVSRSRPNRTRSVLTIVAHNQQAEQPAADCCVWTLACVFQLASRCAPRWEADDDCHRVFSTLPHGSRFSRFTVNMVTHTHTSAYPVTHGEG